MQCSSTSTAWICSTLLNTALAYYDKTQPVIVQTNASEYGLGATLIQSGWPITFASKTLTDVETHYAALRKTAYWCALALRNSTPTYSAGMSSSRVTVKPLEMTQHSQSMPHTPIMELYMQKYDYTVQYKPGK